MWAFHWQCSSRSDLPGKQGLFHERREIRMHVRRLMSSVQKVRFLDKNGRRRAAVGTNVPGQWMAVAGRDGKAKSEQKWCGPSVHFFMESSPARRECPVEEEFEAAGT